MSSGRRNTVLICCNFEHSALYLDSVGYYRPDTAHIFVNNDVGIDRQSIRCDDTNIHE